MLQYLASHETAITWYAFVCAFMLIGVAETLRPRKGLGKPVARRWIGNGLLAACDIAVEAFVPLGGAIVAVMAANNPYGLLNSDRVPLVFRFLAAVVLLDLYHYAEHYLLHRVPLLWRIHQVHHSDADFDLTTGVRNHPVEVLLKQGLTFGVIALLAPPPVAVILMGTATALQNLFSHANVRLPQRLDAVLRPFLITPDVHRIHHSQQFSEQNTNFGFLFPWWDKLFRTYQSQPVEGHERMRIGLENWQDDRSMNVLHMLAMPFRKTPDPANVASEYSSRAATGD